MIFSLFFFIGVFFVFQYAAVPKKLSLFLEPLYVSELTNLTLIKNFLKEKISSNELTKQDTLHALRMINDIEKEREILLSRIHLLENELPPSSFDGKREKTWVIHKNLQRAFLIEGGEERGFQKGDIAVSRLGEAIGFIQEVFPQSSKVFLFSHVGTHTEGILSPLNITIKVEGNGRNAYSILPREAEVGEGNEIFLQCLHPLPLGTVTHIEFAPQDPEKIITIQTKLAPSQVQSVEVLKGSGKICAPYNDTFSL